VVSGGPGDSGYRLAPHTADLRIEAWAPSREECLAQAVRALVASFAETGPSRPVRAARRRLAAGGPTADADLLAAALEEVIFRLDADGEVPAVVSVSALAGGAVELELGLVPLGSVTVTGAGPKAVSLHEIRCAPDESGRWLASATIDV